jgi:hypothetical protein
MNHGVTTWAPDCPEEIWSADCVEVIQYVEQIPGPPGKDGVDGTGEWLFGNGPPSAETGFEGQIYHDSSTGKVHKRIGADWIFQFTIVGASPFIGYLHTQISPLDVWTIAHNLSRKPLVAVTSIGGVEWLGGEILHLSTNVLQITFDEPAAGFARCI